MFSLPLNEDGSVNFPATYDLIGNVNRSYEVINMFTAIEACTIDRCAKVAEIDMRKTFKFRRYNRGRDMKQNIRIEKEETLKAAMLAAVKLADPLDVLVLISET